MLVERQENKIVEGKKAKYVCKLKVEVSMTNSGKYDTMGFPYCKLVSRQVPLLTKVRSRGSHGILLRKVPALQYLFYCHESAE
jgi:hypothetical protein